jgi:hypothetical protein
MLDNRKIWLYSHRPENAETIIGGDRRTLPGFRYRVEVPKGKTVKLTNVQNHRFWTKLRGRRQLFWSKDDDQIWEARSITDSPEL